MGNQTEELSNDLKAFQQESERSFERLKGYGLELDLTEWLTIKRYAEKYNVSQQVVVNWIGRGVIPTDCVQDVPELNNMRLIKDQPYR